ncbi:MAG: dehydrogenase [Gammaproteobacteria bacterium RIFCSPHIGHO2_12_FULL_37_14]|nr:MAG: dehydrogenase [Gammaproteobacteria bacterium RIFCSPHIGHO2_12_FULL_37_14]
MKAAILVETQQPLVITDIELPEDLSFGQVLVKVHYSTICGSQINEINGAKGSDKFLPHLLGHEGVGTVEKMGPGVTHVNKGDRVIMHWRPGKGIQCQPPKYKWGNKVVNSGWVTTFSEYSIVSENRLTKVPDKTDLKTAPLFGCAVTTAMGVINNDAKVKIGESVVIFGIGGVGLNLVQAAAMVSAYPIIGIDLFDAKLELAKKFGLTHAINSANEKNMTEKIAAILGNKGADVVIDTTGITRIIEKAYELTHSSGRTILVGVPKAGDNISIYSLPLHFNKSIKGSHGGSAIPDEDIPRYMKLLKEGKMTLDGLITHELPLSHINDAVELMKSGKIAGRILVNMEN